MNQLSAESSSVVVFIDHWERSSKSQSQISKSSTNQKYVKSEKRVHSSCWARFDNAYQWLFLLLNSRVRKRFL